MSATYKVNRLIADMIIDCLECDIHPSSESIRAADEDFPVRTRKLRATDAIFSDMCTNLFISKDKGVCDVSSGTIILPRDEFDRAVQEQLFSGLKPFVESVYSSMKATYFMANKMLGYTKDDVQRSLAFEEVKHCSSVDELLSLLGRQGKGLFTKSSVRNDVEATINVDGVYQRLSGYTQELRCHRYGDVRRTSGERRPKRSKKCECQARIMAFVSSDSVYIRRCNLSIYHTNHVLGSTEDEYRLPVCPESKEFALKMLRTGLSPRQVFNILELYAAEADKSDETKRLTMTVKEIGNLCYKELQTPTSQDWFQFHYMVENNSSDSVLMFQKFDPDLKLRDPKRGMILILQTPLMKHWQKRFSRNNSWQCDSTFGVNMFGFPLYALTVTNAYGQGVPIAFMICSTEKGSGQEAFALEHFFREVLKSGAVPNGIFIDKHAISLKSLVKIKTELKLQYGIYLCDFHVKKAWSENALPKVQQSLQKDLYGDLCSLSLAKTVADFNKLKTEFISKWYSNERLKVYMEQKWFSEEWKFTWPRCYRDCALGDVTTTNHQERQWHYLKYSIFQCKINKSLSRLVEALIGVDFPGGSLVVWMKRNQDLADSKKYTPRAAKHFISRQKAARDLFGSDEIIMLNDSNLSFNVHDYTVVLLSNFCSCPDVFVTCKHKLACKLYVAKFLPNLLYLISNDRAEYDEEFRTVYVISAGEEVLDNIVDGVTQRKTIGERLESRLDSLLPLLHSADKLSEVQQYQLLHILSSTEKQVISLMNTPNSYPEKPMNTRSYKTLKQNRIETPAKQPPVKKLKSKQTRNHKREFTRKMDSDYISANLSRHSGREINFPTAKEFLKSLNVEAFASFKDMLREFDISKDKDVDYEVTVSGNHAFTDDTSLKLDMIPSEDTLQEIRSQIELHCRDFEKKNVAVRVGSSWTTAFDIDSCRVIQYTADRGIYRNCAVIFDSMIRCLRSLKSAPTLQETLRSSHDQPVLVVDMISWIESLPLYRENICDRIHFTLSSLLTLCPGEWLDDEIMNGYLEILCHRNYNGLKVKYLDSHWVAKDEEGLKRWLLRKEPDDADLFIIPINYSNVHWAIAVMENDYTIRYYDSLSGYSFGRTSPLGKLFQRAWSEYSKVAGLQQETITFTKVNSPLQRDSHNCGIYALYMVECLLSGMNENEILDPVNMSYLRCRVLASFHSLQCS